jgi:hypothetical protein
MGSHPDSLAPATAWIRRKYDFFSKLLVLNQQQQP